MLLKNIMGQWFSIEETEKESKPTLPHIIWDKPPVNYGNLYYDGNHMVNPMETDPLYRLSAFIAYGFDNDLRFFTAPIYLELGRAKFKGTSIGNGHWTANERMLNRVIVHPKATMPVQLELEQTMEYLWYDNQWNYVSVHRTKDGNYQSFRVTYEDGTKDILMPGFNEYYHSYEL